MAVRELSSSARRGVAAGPAPGPPPAGSVASVLAPMLDRLFPDGLPVRFEFWDESALGPPVEASTAGRALLRSPDALRRILWSPGELGVARGFVAGDLEIEGDVYAVLRALLEARHGTLPTPRELFGPTLRAVRALRLYSPPPPPPAVEARLSGWRAGLMHSLGRDARAVTHHYDVGNEFYRLVLGESMTYSCARFVTPETTLAAAQEAKHELVCRKLGLHERPGLRLLDVGCGWGSMAMHAASRHGATVVGVTLSPAQASLARERVAAAGLADRVEIRIQDYRKLGGEQFDAISSIGMFEHVGEARMAEYFSVLFGLLTPTGRLLNHAISSEGGSKMRGRSFMNRYVFPDGELIDVAVVVRAMEQAGFEVRDVESLREHYAKTLRCWVDNLQSNWADAVRLAGAERARVWRLYMSASVNGFEDSGISLHQVLGVKRGPGGLSAMPATRREWG